VIASPWRFGENQGRLHVEKAAVPSPPISNSTKASKSNFATGQHSAIASDYVVVTIDQDRNNEVEGFQAPILLGLLTPELFADSPLEEGIRTLGPTL